MIRQNLLLMQTASNGIASISFLVYSLASPFGLSISRNSFLEYFTPRYSLCTDWVDYVRETTAGVCSNKEMGDACQCPDQLHKKVAEILNSEMKDKEIKNFDPNKQRTSAQRLSRCSSLIAESTFFSYPIPGKSKAS